MSKLEDNNWFSSGDHNAICDVCGRKFKSSELRTRWDGALVCARDFEYRHPQQRVRDKADKITPEKVRVPIDDRTSTAPCSTRSAIAGVAVAGCMIAGFRGSSTMPTGTFSGSGL